MKNNSLKINYIYNLGYQILSLITPFITSPYTSRLFQADGIGIQSYVNSISYYFSLFGALGVATYGQREIARNRENIENRSYIFWELFILKTISMSICIGIYASIILNIKENQLYYWISLTSLLGSVLDISWYFMGLENFRLIVLRNAIVKVISIVILFAFIKSKDQLPLYMLLNTVTLLLAYLTMWPYVIKSLYRVSIKKICVFRHLKETMVYFVPTIATSVYTVLDKVMIGIITKKTVENGYYEQATKIINMVKTVLLSLNSVMMSRMSYLFRENKIDEVKSKINLSLDYIMFMGIGMCFGLIGIARGFVPWFFGEGYTPVIYMLYIFSPIIIIIGISNCIGSMYYTPIGLRSLSAKIIITGSILNFILNALLTPVFGAYGTAAASLIAELLITVLYVRYSDNYVEINILFLHAWKKILAGLVMLATIFAISNLKMKAILLTLIEIITGIIIYWGVLLLLKDSFADYMLKNIYTMLSKIKKQKM